MSRTSLAAMLAAPLLLMSPAFVRAHPAPCFAPFRGGCCLACFSKLHQHGPLYNYGPYYGYPPFEPYGPWNAYLQYNPWYYGGGAGGGNMYGWNQHFFHGEHAGLGGGCAGCGHLHTNWLHGGWFHGHGCIGCGSHSLLHRGGFAGQDCSTCTAPTTAAPAGGGSKAELSTDPATRLAGAGAPEEFASYYAGLPAIETQGVPTASGER